MFKILSCCGAVRRPVAILGFASVAAGSLMFSALADDLDPVIFDGEPVAADTVLVKFSAENGDAAVKSGSKNPRIARVAARIRRIKMFRQLHRQAVIELNQDGSGDRATRLKERIQELRDTGLFEYVEPDYILTASATPADAAFADGRLWGLRNTGQDGGKSGSDIEAVQAWDQTKGSANVVVGVIDSGIRYTHQDLEGNMWVNTDEIPDNGIDDDDNGYVDDVHGMNAIDGSGDPMDDNDHGSHCAGTIGATANGGGPHVGVAWNVSLMALKFLSATGRGSTSNAIECIDYAIDQGVDILNNSWGGGSYSQALYDAINRTKDAGILFVVAAGNDGKNNDSRPSYPANYAVSNIISVVALDRNDKLASFSNYGASLTHLGAPGVEIYSCTAASDTSYSIFKGTSMAAPHVSGVAALVKSKFPNLTVSQLKARLLDNTRPVASLTGKTVTGGAVSAKRALDNVPVPAPDVSVFAAANLPKNIPDHGKTTSSIDVTGQPASIALNDVIVKLNVTHTYVGDLVITLSPPKGPSIKLWNRAGRVQGSVVLNQALGVGKTVNPNGTWKLKVEDKAKSDVGTLNSWSLEFPAKN